MKNRKIAKVYRFLFLACFTILYASWTYPENLKSIASLFHEIWALLCTMVPENLPSNENSSPLLGPYSPIDAPNIGTWPAKRKLFSRPFPASKSLSTLLHGIFCYYQIFKMVAQVVEIFKIEGWESTCDNIFG